MRQQLQKAGEPYLYQKIGRFISIYFTKGFLKTSITANQVSILFCISSVISCVFLYLTIAEESPLYFLLCIFFLYLFIILDGVDGEIARDRKTASPITGKVIDVIFHEIYDNCVIIMTALGIYAKSNSSLPLMICLFLYFGRKLHKTIRGYNNSHGPITR